MNLLQPWHIILIVVVVLILYGGKKLPELARGIGKSVGEFAGFDLRTIEI